MKISFLFIPNELTHVRLDDSKFQYINYLVQSDYYPEICNILQTQLCERESPPNKIEIINLFTEIFAKYNIRINDYDFGFTYNMLDDNDRFSKSFKCTIEIL